MIEKLVSVSFWISGAGHFGKQIPNWQDDETGSWRISCHGMVFYLRPTSKHALFHTSLSQIVPFISKTNHTLNNSFALVILKSNPASVHCPCPSVLALARLSDLRKWYYILKYFLALLLLLAGRLRWKDKEKHWSVFIVKMKMLFFLLYWHIRFSSPSYLHSNSFPSKRKKKIVPGMKRHENEY